MNKEFVPYEQALELKELGFDDVCLGYYHTTLSSSDVDLIIGKTPNRFYHLIGIPEHFDTLAPLYQQVFRWFREKYGLYSEIFVDDSKTFGFLISSFIEEGRLDKPITRQFNTYEEAELGCVKQLIEIVERKAEAYN